MPKTWWRVDRKCADGFYFDFQLVKAGHQRRGRRTTSKYSKRAKGCQSETYVRTLWKKSFLYMQGFFWFLCCASERRRSVGGQDQLHSSNLSAGRGSMSLLSSEGFQHWSSCLAPQCRQRSFASFLELNIFDLVRPNSHNPNVETDANHLQSHHLMSL